MAKQKPKIIVFTPLCGTWIENAIVQALIIASKRNCKVKLKFNDLSLLINKRLSVDHLLRTWNRMIEAVHRRVIAGKSRR